MNLYETLGVTKNVKLPGLRKAYLRRVREAHPDTGGSNEEFRAVNLAYRVLSDPAQRQRYDASGEYSEQPANDQLWLGILTLLSQAFVAVIQEMAKKNLPPAEEDVARHLREALKQLATTRQQNRQHLEKLQEYLRASQGRFTRSCKDGEPEQENVLDRIVVAHLARVQQDLERVRHEEAVHQLALEQLGRYGWKHTERVVLAHASTSSGSATASSNYVPYMWG